MSDPTREQIEDAPRTDADNTLEHAQRLQSRGMVRSAERLFLRAAKLFEHEGRSEEAQYAREGAEYCGREPI